MKKVYIVFIDENIMLSPGDSIDSIWFSKRKANKRKDEAIEFYGEDHVIVLIREISK